MPDNRDTLPAGAQGAARQADCFEPSAHTRECLTTFLHACDPWCPGQHDQVLSESGEPMSSDIDAFLMPLLCPSMTSTYEDAYKYSAVRVQEQETDGSVHTLSYMFYRPHIEECGGYIPDDCALADALAYMCVDVPWT